MNRRDILKLGALLLCPVSICGTQTTKVQLPTKIDYCVKGRRELKRELRNQRFRPTSAMNELLRRIGNHNYKVSEKAMGEFVLAIYAPMIHEILLQTGLKSHYIAPGTMVPQTSYMDIAGSASWSAKYARTCRWDVIAGSLQDMQKTTIKKINKEKRSGSFIEGFHVWSDPLLFRQGKRGFYGWVELRNPK